MRAPRAPDVFEVEVDVSVAHGSRAAIKTRLSTFYTIYVPDTYLNTYTVYLNTYKKRPYRYLSVNP